MRLTFIASVLLFLLLLAPVGLSATAVLLLHTPARIILAADSMLVTQHGGDRADSRSCKIHQAGRWWTALAGFSRNTNPPLDVEKILIDAIAPTRTLTAAGDAITRSVFPRIERTLSNVRQTSSFRGMFHVGQLITSLAVVGQDATGNTLRSGLFGITLDSIEPFTLTSSWLECPGELCPTGEVFYGASVDSEGPAVALLVEPRAAWVQKADAAAAYRIVSEQIRASPSLVSGPVNVLEIRSSGARWYRPDPASTCAAVNPN